MTALRYRTIALVADCPGRFRANGPYAADLHSGLVAALHGTPALERLFEPQLPARPAPASFRGTTTPPTPLALVGPSPHRLAERGGRLRFSVTTVRVEDRDVAALSGALQEMCRVGVGDPRVQLTPVTEDRTFPRAVADGAEASWQRIAGDAKETEVRIRFGGPVLILKSKLPVLPTPASLVRAVLHRWRLLDWAYGAGDAELDAGAFELAASLERERPPVDRTRWWSGWRVSARQQARVPMRGFLGSVECRVPRRVGLVLAAGAILGVGKGISTGQGAYRLERMGS